MNVFEAVKQTIPTRDAALAYGIKVNRNGMACCPFHSDRTPSMKLDKRFHCFGCQADGDVIDFTARLHGLSLTEAARKLAQDFGVPYKSGQQKKQDQARPRASPIQPKLSAEQEYQAAEQRVYRVYCDYFHLLRSWKEEYAPRNPEEEWDERFVEACQKIDYVEYLLDTLLAGSIEERAAIVKEHAKRVIQLERRISDITKRRTGSSFAGRARTAGAGADAGNRNDSLAG